MTLSISYPFKHFNVTQKWGNPNPAYAQFGFTKHNGIDANSSYNNATTSYNPKTFPVYCPVEGFMVDKVQYRPNGGGNEIWMISKDTLQVGDKQCLAYFVMCHAEHIFLKAGDEPSLGELVMIADNTGFSTGPHTHMGLYRVAQNGASYTFLDTNDANGSYDPALFFTGEYAVDQATLSTLIQNNLLYYRYMAGLIA